MDRTRTGVCSQGLVKRRWVGRRCVVPTTGVHREPEGPHNQAPGPVCCPALPHAVHRIPGASTGRREWVGLTQGTSSPPVTTPSAPPTQVYLHVSGSEPACTRCVLRVYELCGVWPFHPLRRPLSWLAQGPAGQGGVAEGVWRFASE